MNYRTILLPALACAIMVLYLHSTALTNHLYFVYWWFDMVIHFLTGLTISMTLLYLVRSVSPNRVTSINSSAIVVLPVVLVFAVGWEVFELYAKLVYARGIYYMFDTTIDIFMGLLGGMIGVLYVSRFIMTSWQKQQ